MSHSRARGWARIAGYARTVAFMLGLAAATATAQPVSKAPELGTLRGLVVDAQTQKPLPFTNVAFYRITAELPEGLEYGGTLGQKDGSFSKDVPPGTYRVVSRYVSYDRGEVRDVVVQAGQVTTVTVPMVAKPIETKTVKVSGERSHD